MSNDIRAKYDYLDNLDAPGWIWEFVRRNTEYRNIYADLEELLPNAELSTDEPYLTPQDIPLKLISNPKIVSKKLELMERMFGVKPNTRVGRTSEGYLVKEVKGTGAFIGIPNPDMRHCDLSPEPVIRGAKPVASARFKDKAINELRHGNIEEFYRYCFKTINKISPSLDIENTMYIGISLNAKKDDVKEYLDKLVDKYVVPLKVKIRPEKWKFYLITYDLRTGPKKITYTEIGDLLSTAYPDVKSLFDDLNIQNYKKNAVALIASEFQKYMYL